MNWKLETLSVSGSLIRRTSRELWRTILLYSLLSVRGLSISTISSLPTAIFGFLKRTGRGRNRFGGWGREEGRTVDFDFYFGLVFVWNGFDGDRLCGVVMLRHHLVLLSPYSLPPRHGSWRFLKKSFCRADGSPFTFE